jgi:hypothetical protein
MALQTTIQVYRGTKANLPSLAEGQFGLATNTGELFIGNTGNVRMLTTADGLTSTTVTIATGDWVAKVAAKAVSGMTSTKTVWVSPAVASYANYVDAEIRATAQDTDEVTFTCETTPTESVTVNVVFMEPLA